ncbi:MAG: hypothetical protein DRP01_01040 [Archaeoglobales archaeon]|nr:MAG: hypothetical protein DRP01_01040 [Archaeoglobales archaeon]
MSSSDHVQITFKNKVYSSKDFKSMLRSILEFAEKMEGDTELTFASIKIKMTFREVEKADPVRRRPQNTQ